MSSQELRLTSKQISNTSPFQHRTLLNLFELLICVQFDNILKYLQTSFLGYFKEKLGKAYISNSTPMRKA